MRCDMSLLFTLGLGLTADLLTAGCCTDPRPLGFSTTSIKDSDALSFAEESGLRGCRIADEPALDLDAEDRSY